MRGLTKLLVVLIVSGALVGCASRSSTALTAAQRAALHIKTLQDAGLRYYWRCDDLAKFRLMSGGESIARTYVIDENFYCLTSMNRLIAIDAARGTLQWSKWVHVAKPGAAVFDPVHVNGITIPRTTPTRKEVLQPRSDPTRGVKPYDIVIISTRTHALVIDRKTGDEIRNIKFNFGASATAGVCSDGRLLFVPDSRGWYNAILLHEMIHSWTLSVEGAIKVAPVYIADKVIVASEDGQIQVANTYEARKKVWTRQIDAGIEAPILATENHLLVPCVDRRLHAFDPSTGQRLWEPFDCKKALTNAPQISDVSVFQYARGGDFHALGLVSGKLRWTSSDARKVLAAMDNNVYLQDNRNRILLVDEILGDVKNTIQMPRGDLLAANTSAPAIYGATRNGKLYCIRRLAAGHITAEMLRKK
ncbi:MAG: PQQ-binding-like beta-propeller repeat protein [Phycisphaerae bacterium]|nr:PQQ-binding-like beta-propeller repeat protein [Phycisphaerae bacterium]